MAKFHNKCVNKLAPNYLCNLFTARTLSFDLGGEGAGKGDGSPGE